MKLEHESFDPALERAIQEIHDEPVDRAVIEAAAGRVWSRISAELKPSGGVIRGCAGFQALIPDYVSGRLPEASALLLKDHTHECVSCRKRLDAASGRVVEMKAAPAQNAKRPAARRLMRWAVAAAFTLGVGFTAWNVVNTLPAPGRAQATVEWVNGGVYQVSNDRSVPLQPGEILPAGAEIRTGKDSG
ncbi:MAG: zf-HC2 domain-containing protein, partial [Bryobacteraceae bacterium]|nr:zf-HC2 domain-containing protein [Bryobacteraceae bacterium]